MTIVNSICNDMGVADYKKVKPGVGETTRVLLRRVPWKVLINNSVEDTDEDIQHILVLCKEKNIPVERYSLGHYKVCGIIKELSADA
jgi:ribosomal protein L7Ae-like RNA K-turn-binding protein